MKKTFGLGDDSNIESIEVRWSNSIMEKISNPKTNKYYSFPLESTSDTKLSYR